MNHVIPNGDLTKGERELLQAVHKQFPTPPVLSGVAGLENLAFGKGTSGGVGHLQHNCAWLGLVSGAKLWYLGAPHLSEPTNPSCTKHELDGVIAANEGVIRMLQLPGEIIWFPDGWWHATCNFGDYTVGMGGQSWMPDKAGT